MVENTIAPFLDETRLRAFEAELPLPLDPSYRAFLMEWTGGRPYPNCVYWPAAGQHLGLNCFFAIDARDEGVDLWWNYELWISDCPAHLLPFACDGGGSCYCVSLYGPDTGRIHYWDYYRGNHPWYGQTTKLEPTYPSIYLLAPSFGDFLNMIVDPPEG